MAIKVDVVMRIVARGSPSWRSRGSRPDTFLQADRVGNRTSCRRGGTLATRVLTQRPTAVLRSAPWQHASRSVDQQPAQVFVAAFGYPEGLGLAAGGELSRHETNLRRLQLSPDR